MAELLQPLLGGPRAADRRACWSPLLLACAKKTDRPPGAPEIRPATPAEVLLAQEVYDERLVA
jgi:hypothetical protein